MSQNSECFQCNFTSSALVLDRTDDYEGSSWISFEDLFIGPYCVGDTIETYEVPTNKVKNGQNLAKNMFATLCVEKKSGDATTMFPNAPFVV